MYYYEVSNTALPYPFSNRPSHYYTPTRYRSGIWSWIAMNLEIRSATGIMTYWNERKNIRTRSRTRSRRLNFVFSLWYWSKISQMFHCRLVF